MHEMSMEKKHPSGLEEWYCPICFRRILILFHPYEKHTLEVGDESVIHIGGHGIGFTIETVLESDKSDDKEEAEKGDEHEH